MSHRNRQFQPLPPLVRMEKLPTATATTTTTDQGDKSILSTLASPLSSKIIDDDNDDCGRNNNEDDWMTIMSLSPTNRNVALLIPTCTSNEMISTPSIMNDEKYDNNNIRSSLYSGINHHHDDNDLLLWNHSLTDDDNIMMMMEEEENVNIVHHHYPETIMPQNSAKRVSLDVLSGEERDCSTRQSYNMQIDVGQQADCIMMDHDNNDHDDDDPLLASLTCPASNDDHVIILASEEVDRISDTMIIPDDKIVAAIPPPLPALSNLLPSPSSRNHLQQQQQERHGYDDCIDYDADNNNDDENKYCDFNFDEDDLDAWTTDHITAAANATTLKTGLYTDNDLMIFEIDQSFLKTNARTVGTESTVSSYSSISPDLHSLNNNYNTTTTAVPPTFFTSTQFQERCKLLAESMRASQLSRQCLSLQENIKLRANLAKVLKDIENSTAKVQRHCLSQQLQHQQEQQHDPASDIISRSTAEITKAGTGSSFVAIDSAEETFMHNEIDDKNNTLVPTNNPMISAMRLDQVPVDMPESKTTTTADSNVEYHSNE